MGFIHKMAAKIRYGTKLRRCHPLYISEPANGRLVGSWFYGVVLISRAWIRRLVPLFSERRGNCPKFRQKFDSALIRRRVVAKRHTM